MIYIILGAVISILVGFITFLKDLEDFKKSRTKGLANVFLLIFLTIGVLLSLFYAMDLKDAEKLASGKAIKKEKSVDSLNSLLSESQTKMISLQNKQLDSISDLLQASVTIINLQRQVNELQNAVYDEVSGGNKWEQAFTTYILINEETHLPTIVISK